MALTAAALVTIGMSVCLGLIPTVGELVNHVQEISSAPSPILQGVEIIHDAVRIIS